MSDEKSRHYCRLFWLQSAVRDILFGERVTACCRMVVPGKNVQVWGDVVRKRAKYRNVVRCANIWQCPVCANNITAHRRDELQTVMSALDNLVPVMVSFTIEHHAGDRLDHLVGILSEAWRGMTQCNCFNVYKRNGALAGIVRSQEVTFSAGNGWHPHYHGLFFMKNSGQIAGFYADLRTLWAEHVSMAGGNTKWEYATMLTVADSSIAAYIAKWGHDPSEDTLPQLTRWGKAQEMTRSPLKTSHSGHYTPFEMLEEYLINGAPSPAYWGRLYKDYAAAMKGQRQLTWSRKPDLRALAGIADEKTDNQIVEGEEAGYILLAQLTPTEWKAIIWAGMRGVVLDCCARGDMDMANTVIFECIKEHAVSQRGNEVVVLDESTGELTTS